MTLKKPSILLMLACLVWAIPSAGTGQHLVYAEYFIDTDPGQGFGTSILPCDGVFDETTEEFCVDGIPTPDLDDGPHVFFLRMRDSENVWGMRRMVFYSASSSPYVAKQIQAAEYYVDLDPGEGMGTALDPVDGLLSSDLEYLTKDMIESSDLSLGEHVVYARVQDTYGVWSRPRQVTFSVVESLPYRKLTQAEYFIDTDPGVGLGTALNAVDGSFDEAMEAARLASIGVASICPGDHMVYVRFRDNGTLFPSQRNGWGPAKGKLLQVCGRPCPPATVITTSGCETVMLSWSASPTAIRYQIWRDGAPIAYLTGMAYTDTVKTPGLHRYVIRAANDWGIGDSVMVFDSAFLRPPPIVLESPNDGAIDRPTTLDLCWDSTGSRDADLYHVVVSTDSTFSSGLAADVESSELCAQVGELQHDTKYFWRVQGQDSCGWGDWSAVWAFTTVPCCEGRVGDADGSGSDEPSIGDVSVMIDAAYITGSCITEGVGANIRCIPEADINQDGGVDPACDDISIGDISLLIDYLFITGLSAGLRNCL